MNRTRTRLRVRPVKSPSLVGTPGDPKTTTEEPQRPDLDLRGGDERTRTADPLLAKQVLYQLSYAPVTC